MPVSPFKATWARLLSSDRLRRSSQALSVIDQSIYIFGGEVLPRQPIDDQIDIVTFASGDAPTLRTTNSPVAPSPRVGTASAVLGGRLYLFSGRGGTDMAPIEERGAVWSYSPSQETWEKIKPADPSQPFPPARSYHCATSNGREAFFIHAGCPVHGRLSDLWEFDVVSRAWTRHPDAPAPPRGGTSIAYNSGKLYRMNGFDGDKEQGGSIDIFDLAAGSWSSEHFPSDGNAGPEPRSVCTLLPVKLLGRQKLLTFFGERDPSSLGHAGAGKMLSDVWLYDIGEKWWTKLDSEGANGSPHARGWFAADSTKDEQGNDCVILHGGLGETNDRFSDIWLLKF